MKNNKNARFVCRNRFIPIALAVSFACIIGIWLSFNSPTPVQPLPMYQYEELKALISTEGTELIAVQLYSTDGRIANGTIIKNEKTEIIITAAHYFATQHPNTTYWYTHDGITNYVHSVFAHPKPGPLGERDIAFCVPGQMRKIMSFSNFERNTPYTNINISKIKAFDMKLLKDNISLKVCGILFMDQDNPFYLVPYKSRDGESGSGLVGNKRFFVLTGNIPISSLDISKVLDTDASDLTLVTEL